MHSGDFKFHKVVWRYYSGEVENVYMILQQIYSGNHYQILSKSPGFCRRYYKKVFWSFFPDTLYVSDA